MPFVERRRASSVRRIDPSAYGPALSRWGRSPRARHGDTVANALEVGAAPSNWDRIHNWKRDPKQKPTPLLKVSMDPSSPKDVLHLPSMQSYHRGKAACGRERHFQSRTRGTVTRSDANVPRESIGKPTHIGRRRGTSRQASSVVETQLELEMVVDTELPACRTGSSEPCPLKGQASGAWKSHGPKCFGGAVARRPDRSRITRRGGRRRGGRPRTGRWNPSPGNESNRGSRRWWLLR